MIIVKRINVRYAINLVLIAIVKMNVDTVVKKVVVAIAKVINVIIAESQMLGAHGVARRADDFPTKFFKQKEHSKKSTTPTPQKLIHF